MYAELFGESIQEYNDRQSRSDRKKSVQSYFDEVKADERGKARMKKIKVDGKSKPVRDERSRKGKKTSYEVVVSIQGFPPEVAKAVARLYDETFEERNPNFRKVRADWHEDESGEPHLHEAYIPYATGFKQGLSVQQSQNKALKAMGLSSMQEWHDRENEYIQRTAEMEYARYCARNAKFQDDVEWQHPYAGKDVGTMDTVQYAELQEKRKAFEAEKERTEQDLWKRRVDLIEKEDALTHSEAQIAEKLKRVDRTLREAENALKTAQNASEGALGVTMESWMRTHYATNPATGRKESHYDIISKAALADRNKVLSKGWTAVDKVRFEAEHMKRGIQQSDDLEYN